MSDLPAPIDLSRPPSLAREFTRAMLTTALPAKRRPEAEGLPDTVLRLPNATVDRSHLIAYQKITGFPLTDALPPTYPHLLGFPLQARLLAAPGFPLPLPGLVHIANEITQHTALTADAELAITVQAEGLRPHPQGTAVDLNTTAQLDGAVAWSSRSTYLHRGSKHPDADPGSRAPKVPDTLPAQQWRLPADLGRRYAAISGDVNPIHLNPWAAKAFGFPRTIVHGMWSLARTLAAFGPDVAQPHTNRVWFRKPILLPSTVAYVREPSTPIAAVVSPKDRTRIHLVAEVRAP